MPNTTENRLAGPMRLLALVPVCLSGIASAACPIELLGEARDGVAASIAYTPQYPLWTDGAAKKRWIHVPEGQAVDASAPDDWRFPAGTRLWKEFSFGGRKLETRLLERLPDGSWRFCAFIWDRSGHPRAAEATGETIRRPDGLAYDVPSQQDCRACHADPERPALGFTLLQLSGDRRGGVADAAVEPNDSSLATLLARGVIEGLPVEWRVRPVRAGSALDRAAAGYLHGNCGHCHSDRSGAVRTAFHLSLDPVDPESAERLIASLKAARARYRFPGVDSDRLLVPGHPESSLLSLRMHSRHPARQMPPLGTRQVDADGVDLVDRWIRSLAGEPR